MVRRGAVLALALGLIAALPSCGFITHGPEEGPLVKPGPLAYVMKARPGRTFTDGSVVLDLTGSERARLVKVESVGGDGAFEFLGARLAGPKRKYTADQWRTGWPPMGFRIQRITPVEGALLKPSSQTWHKQAYELLLGYRVLKSQYAVRSGVAVTYTVGEETYRVVLPQGLVTCPVGANQSRCRDRGFRSMQDS